jgi:hypothetical protein
VLAAGDSGWTDVTAMSAPRQGAAVGVLADGQVIFAGGETLGNATTDSAELWDASTGVWHTLPPMHTKRVHAVSCILPSRHFAVIGGRTEAESWRVVLYSGDAWKLGSGVWELCPRCTASKHVLSGGRPN